MKYFETKELPDSISQASRIISWVRHLTLKDGVLYHIQVIHPPGRIAKVLLQLMVPTSLKAEVLELIHSAPLAGHPGISKTFEKARSHFYWMNMFDDIVKFVKSCENCQYTKDPPVRETRTTYLTRPQPTEPWTICSMDVMHLPLALGKKYVLIIVDLFTRWPEAFALSKITGEAICLCLKKIIYRFGLIQQLLCDNATYNVGKEVKQFCRSKQIQLSPVTEYHPQANGIAESKVHALKMLLKSLCTQYNNWEQYLEPALFAYRTTYHRTIRETPYFLNHGRDARTFMGQLNEIPFQPNPECYSQQLEEQMQRVFLQVKTNLEQRQQKLFKDSSTLLEVFKIGQLVLFYNPVLPVHEHPTFHRFWTGPYVIIQKINPFIYRIQKLSEDKSIRRAHYSRLKLWFDRSNLQQPPISQL